jgi:hypothetical protein
MTLCSVGIVGMHRSGTSLVTQSMHELGVYLGDESDLLPPSSDDNCDGYWENRRFLEINEAILRTFGGTWKAPPEFPSDWLDRKEVMNLHREAEKLISEFQGKAPWVWKDPRTTLTIPFWLRLMPDLRLVVCLRHPLEVAQSLSARTQEYVSQVETVVLWERYYRSVIPLLDTGSALVTHYSSHFYDARSELSRIAEFIGISIDPDRLTAAAGIVDPTLYRGFIPDDADFSGLITNEVASVYQTLCTQCGPVFEAQRDDEVYQQRLRNEVLRKALSRVRRLEESTAARQQEIEQLRQMTALLESRLSFYRLPKSLVLGPTTARREALQLLHKKVMGRLRGPETDRSNRSGATTS